ncbi:efflux RND transporter periplasmic adaptor subunit [Geoalkalibacter subterraneus]|uniref:efflux RND transporter periplasmic adaptor subunit n=1 Tax=Geoalkalibacter subterraneus TaxID=483547 RepID=UPI000694E954|nr:efflux RND transporter periplasmic adaptor subunit [Geoalkalibacter subterraneus]
MTKRKALIFSFIAVVIIAVGTIWMALSGLSALPGAVEAEQRAVFEVVRGDLTISVLEAGTIQARDQVVIKNEVEGRTTILSLVEEGSHVRKGDLLIELDASQLQDALVDQQIRVQNAEAAYIRSRENLEVIRNQARSDVEKARLDAQFAVEDLRKYKEGDYPKQLMEAESTITIREEELRRAQEKLEWSRVLFKEKYISQTELQADELAAQKAQLDLELARAALDLLKNYSNKRELDELESQVSQTAMALERAERKASADVVQAEAELRAKDSEYRREKSKLEKIEQQIAKTRLYAPKDGLVVYATSAQANWRGNVEPLDEGQEVRERQELIYLPAPDSVKAQIKVHESVLDQVKEGLPVRITTNALPGRIFQGRVASIAPLPDAMSVWLNPDLKVYNTDIHLEGDVAGLRTGMSCQAEILIDEIEDALFVPLQSVTVLNGLQVVYIEGARGYVPRPVEVGRNNRRMVHILDGLEEGDMVLLSPPLASGSERGEKEEDELPVTPSEVND